jgi:transposase
LYINCAATDLTDGEWLFLRQFLPCSSAARSLPNDFPPWQTVYWSFRRFVRRLLFKTIHDVALMLNRERESRDASPT